MKRTIKVTAKDIKRGRRSDVSSCPIALAMRRMRLIPLSHIRVGTGYLDFSRSIKFPITVAKFIERFDAGKKVKPFSFTVEVRRRLS